MRRVRKAFARLTGKRHYFAGNEKRRQQQQRPEQQQLAVDATSEAEDLTKHHPQEEVAHEQPPTTPPLEAHWLGNLPRVTEEIDVGCWREVEASSFRVRTIGYAKHSQKAPSADAFYKPLGVSIIRCTAREDDLVERGMLRLPDSESTDFPRYLVINAQLPDDVGPGPLSGRPGPNADGPCHAVIIVCELADWDRIRNSQQSAVRLLRRFEAEAPREPKEQPNVRGRFKVIAGVEDPKQLPAIVRSYNYKPAIITKSGKITRTESALEMHVSIFRFGYSSRSGFASIKDKLHNCVLNVAFVLEGRTDDELPECILAAVQLRFCGFHLAIPFSELAMHASSQHHQKNHQLAPDPSDPFEERDDEHVLENSAPFLPLSPGDADAPQGEAAVVEKSTASVDHSRKSELSSTLEGMWSALTFTSLLGKKVQAPKPTATAPAPPGIE